MKTALLWFQRIFLLSSVCFLIAVLVVNRGDIFTIYAQASFLSIIFASGAWMLTVLLVPFAAFIVLKNQKVAIKLSTLFEIYMSRIPAKYLPGGIWQTFARAYDMNNMGIGKTDIALVVFYENFSTVYLAALISTLGIYLLDGSETYSSLALFLFMGCIATIVIAVFMRDQFFVLSASSYCKIGLVCLAFWMLASISFYSYLTSLAIVPDTYDPLLLMLHYQFSYVAGYVAIFAPQGIGVFEAIMFELSRIDLPLTQALVLIAGFRIVVLVSDFIVWSIFMLIRRPGISAIGE